MIWQQRVSFLGVHRRFVRLGVHSALLAASFLSLIASRSAYADNASMTAAKGSAAHLGTLGLPVVPDGAGARVAILEVENGIPELNPANANMPTAGTGAGQVNIVVGGGVLKDHATTVVGITWEVAPQSFYYHSPATSYYHALSRSQNMLSTTGNSASILNWSWHGFNPKTSDGLSRETMWMDWAVVPGIGSVPVKDEVIIVAGNESAANTRRNPWDNYNGITVAATATNDYLDLASYNGGAGTLNLTTDASPYGNGRVGRFKTDISAPGGGDTVVLAAPVVTSNAGGSRDQDGDGLNSTGTWGGTSFAAPQVAGAAALLQDFGNTQGLLQTTGNELVHKAVLLNAANPAGMHDQGGNPYAPVGTIAQTKSNAGPNEPIYIGWDPDLGTGLLDVGQSLVQYNAGMHKPGAVPLMGWDLDDVGLSGDGHLTETYTFDQGIRTIRATLAWNRLVNLNDKIQTGFTTLLWDTEDTNDNGVLDGGEDLDGDAVLDEETFTLFTLNDLDLELWDATNSTRIWFSNSDMDSIEHFDFAIPEELWGNIFELKVTRFKQWGPADDRYGLAWMATVPEPSSLFLAAVGLVGVVFCLRRQK